MKKIITLLSVASLMMVSLTACIPSVPEMHYEYIPPAAYRGKPCLYQCVKTQNLCARAVYLRRSECLQMAVTEAKTQYQSYVYERKLSNLPIKRTVMSFYRPKFCSNYTNCKTQYKTCRIMCGQSMYLGQHYVDFMKDGNYCHPQQWPNGHCLTEPTHH